MLNKLFLCTIFFLLCGLTYAAPITLNGNSRITLNATIRDVGGGSIAESSSFTLLSDNLSISGTTFSPDSINFPILGNRYAPGDVLPSILNYNFANSRGFNVTNNGATYPTVLYFTSANSMILTTIGDVTIPTLSPTNPLLTVTVPFTMQGMFTLACPPNVQNCPAPSEIMANGSGFVTYTFKRLDNEPRDGVYVSGISYEFKNIEPVPEPATLLLLATGIAGIGGYASRKRKKKLED